MNIKIIFQSTTKKKRRSDQGSGEVISFQSVHTHFCVVFILIDEMATIHRPRPIASIPFFFHPNYQISYKEGEERSITCGIKAV